MVNRNLFFLFIALSSFLFTSAQNKNQQKLDEKKNSLESIMATFTGKPESFDQMIIEGKEGLAFSTNNDHSYRFLFYQAIGNGYYYKQDFKLAAENFEAAYAQALQGKLIEKSTKPLGNLISVYHYMGLQNQADSAAQKLKLIAETVDTLKNKSDIYYNLGLYNQQQKFYYSIALDNFLKSAMLHKSIVDTATAIKLKTDYGAKLMMVAEIYLYLKQPAKALQYLEEVKPYLNLSKVINITAYGKFIRSYVQLNNKTEALKYYTLLHDTAAISPGKWSELVSSNLEMASLALNEKDFPLAKTYIDKADTQSKLDNREILTSAVNLSYGDYYKAMDDYQQAINYYKIAEPGSAQYNKEQYAELLKSLAAVQILGGNKNDASKTFNKYVSLSDSLTNQKIELNLAEMEAQFQNKNKQQQIELKDTELGFAKKQRLWLIAGLILAGIAALLLIMLYRNKKQSANLISEKNKTLSKLNNDLEESNRTKAKLFSIISHDLRSPISQVYQFLKLQQLNPKLLNEQQKNELSNKIQTATGSLLETMEDLLLWSKTQMSEFKINLQEISITDTVIACQNLLQLNSDAKNVQDEIDIQENHVVKSDKYYLQTIIRNLLQNAIKASLPGSVLSIGTKQKNQTIILSIENTGPLFNQHQYEELLKNEETDKMLTGLGLKLTQELCDKMGASLYFSSTSTQTTLTELTLPAK